MGIRIVLSFVIGGMPQVCKQEDLRYHQLYAAYRSEWQAFAREAGQWRLLEDAEQSTPDNIREAQFLAEAAESRYRLARNELWEHIMIHACSKSPAVA